jgi:hypothetical protein
MAATHSSGAEINKYYYSLANEQETGRNATFSLVF